jgi:hypothetical protein
VSYCLALEHTHVCLRKGSKIADQTIWVFENTKSRHKYAYLFRDGHYVLLHRVLMGLDHSDQRVVDHINHNTLDNRYVNLRICFRSENQQNRRKHQHRHGQALTSKYKGVRWHSTRKKWMAQITLKGTNKHLGVFEHEQEAATAYNEAAQKHFGEFACLNDLSCIRELEC